MPILRLALLILLGACGPTPPATDDGAARAEVTAALARYQVAARLVDADSIAAFYAPDGVLFEPGIFPVRGPDSIRAFVRSFPGVEVEVATAIPDTVEIHGTTAYLWGSYHERLSFPGQPRSVQDGKFVIEWTRQPNGAWLIHRFYRVPLPAPTGPPPDSGR